MHLKPKSVAELTRRIEKERVPMRRKLKGFHDEITFVNHRATEAFAISLRDPVESAEVYGRSIFPALLSAITEGTPVVETFDVINSTPQDSARGIRIRIPRRIFRLNQDRRKEGRKP
jgi:hypothetical protein